MKPGRLAKQASARAVDAAYPIASVALGNQPVPAREGRTGNDFQLTLRRHLDGHLQRQATTAL
jgi:hypothetical protein